MGRLLFLLAFFLIGESEAGPYKIIPHRIDHCDDTGSKQIFTDSTRISKTGRNSYTYSTNFTTLLPFDDDIQLSLNYAVWGNGGWRSNYLTLDLGPVCCSFRLYFPQLSQMLMSSMGVKDCPIPPGTYGMANITLTDMKANVPAMPYGVYRVDLNFKKNGILLGCERFYCDLVPRNGKTGRHRK